MEIISEKEILQGRAAVAMLEKYANYDERDYNCESGLKNLGIKMHVYQYKEKLDESLNVRIMAYQTKAIVNLEPREKELLNDDFIVKFLCYYVHYPFLISGGEEFPYSVDSQTEALMRELKKDWFEKHVTVYLFGNYKYPKLQIMIEKLTEKIKGLRI